MKSWFVVRITIIDCGAFQLNQALFDPPVLSTMSKIQEIFSIKMRMELSKLLHYFCWTSLLQIQHQCSGSLAKWQEITCSSVAFMPPQETAHPDAAAPTWNLPRIANQFTQRYPSFYMFPVLRLTRSHNTSYCWVWCIDKLREVKV